MNQPNPKHVPARLICCTKCHYYRNLLNGLDDPDYHTKRPSDNDVSVNRCVHPLLIGGDIHVHSVSTEWARASSIINLDRCGPRAVLFEEADSEPKKLFWKACFAASIIGIAIFIAMIVRMNAGK